MNTEYTYTFMIKKAYLAGGDIYHHSSEVRERYPEAASAKAILLPTIFAVMEMGLAPEEMKLAFCDAMEIARLFKLSLEGS
jgi:hypothetical protein